MAGGAHEHEINDILDLAAQLGANRASVDGLSSAIASLVTAQGAIAKDVEALKARIVELENPSEPPPTPTANKTYFGYTYSGVGKGGLSKAGVVRDFTGGGTISTSQITRTLSTGSALWYSWKPDITGTAWRANVETQLRSVLTPTSAPLYICVWHEPEGSSDAGGGTPDAKATRWRDAHTFLHGIALKLRSEGLPLYVAPIVCDWTFWDTAKGGAKTHWYPTTWKNYDVQGYDVYPRGQMANGSGMIARLTTTGPNAVAPYDHDIRTDTYDAVRLCSEHAKACGKPWGSGETGVIDGSVAGADVQYPYTRAQRAQRFNEIAADIVKLPHPPLLWAWYNDGGCNVTTAPDTASVKAWNDSIAKNPTTKPSL